MKDGLRACVHVDLHCTVIVESYPGCGRPYTASPVANISKVKNLALILLISVFTVEDDVGVWRYAIVSCMPETTTTYLLFSLSSFYILSKSILSNHFATLFCSLTTV